MKRILFQGDSITDCKRGEGMGVGYPNLVASYLSYENPGKYEFINRGISGNRVVDLLARWKKDCTNLKPDYLSILIGVNDVWHEIGEQNGVSAERFEEIYTILIDDVQKALPNTKIMLLSPYITHGAATSEHWEYFSREVEKRRAAVQRVVKAFHLPFIDLQRCFDEKCEDSVDAFWTLDGVHPTQAGHELIKREWIRMFHEM